MIRVQLSVVVFLLALIAPSLAIAQWLNVKVPGTPRTADGKPNLTGPAPRTADGKPDLTGVWAALRDRAPNVVGPEASGNRHATNIGADLPDGLPLTAWARDIRQARRKEQSRDIPSARCLPSGIPPDMLRPGNPFKIIQTTSATVVLLEEFNNWRQIFTDGRKLPEDPQPAWFGYSIGAWDGETFVVKTSGFNDQTWLDGAGRHTQNRCV